MISRLTLHNFKNHLNTELETGGLTVLSGINSAGKSSVLQALLLLRQSFIKGNLKEGLELNHTLCRLGIGQDVLFRRANTGEISFGIQDSQSLSFQFNADDCVNKTFLQRLPGEKIIPSDSLKNISALFSDDFQYISSLRGGGTSHYASYGYEVENQRQISIQSGQGEAVAHFLFKYGVDFTCNYLDEDFGTQIFLSDQVKGWLQKISPGIEFNVQRGLTDGFDILYGYNRVTKDLRAENIGYGISHSLPVVTALVAARPGALILLENPEAHLHPRGQSELAKLICRAVQNGVQVIVETHSDHILSGILLETVRHAKGHLAGIDRNKVSLYYFDLDQDTRTFACPIKVGITDTGRLDYQPEGFFDQEEHVFFETQKILNHADD